VPTRRLLTTLLAPSAPLLLLLLLYERFEGAPHFFLHTLMGWDVALIALLTATYLGRSWSPRDGFLPPGLSLYALSPDFVYLAGPAHRDWMDLFLFHVALDEILPFSLPVLTVLWTALLAGYVRYRARGL
jgi:hypothetical protein